MQGTNIENSILRMFDFFIHWNPNPVLFDLGFIQPKWYGVLFVAGFAIGYLLFKREALKQNISIQKIDNLLFLVLGLSIAFARLAHVFFYDWDTYKNDIPAIFKIWEGGLASHGGMFGAFVGTWIWARYMAKVNFMKIVDLLCVLGPMVGGFIRLGNLMNSEIIGKPSTLPWAFVFEIKDAIPRHPAQLYEAICYFIGFGIMWALYKKFGLRYSGMLAGAVLLIIFIPRFLIEFIKVEQEAESLNLFLNTGQILSIPFMLVGLILMITGFKKPDLIK